MANITQFRSFVAGMPHFRANRDIHMRRYLAGMPSLARPAVHLNEKHIAVGTESKGAEQVLMCMNTELLSNNMEGDPIVARAPLPKAVQGTQWIGPNTVLVCVGDKDQASQMLVFNIDVDGTCVLELKDDTRRFDLTVREMAVNKSERHRVAYGGYDQKLSIMDFNHGNVPTSVFNAEGDVSSVRWEQYHRGRLASCTTNEGQVRIFDVLGGNPRPSWSYQSDVRTHLNLYSHCQVSEWQILLGFEDNYIEAVDIRKNDATLGCFMTGTTDPYCYMVGDLHYRESAGLLMATGMADFSVYQHTRTGPEAGVCKLWCHSTGSTNRKHNDTDAVMHGVFLSDNWVVSTQEASLGLYQIL